MTAIFIQRSHQLGHQGIRDLSEKMAHDLQRQYQIRWQWQGERMTFRRMGARGILVPEAQLVTLDMKLGLVLIPVAPMIRQGIEETLDGLLI
ncbi:putative polyhydroxyalkanoic acid system protein [Ferrimonas sediminum]|uniref:Putative polyhydroxyalkanoic acid system protein n=1 Tax=Ferrimonas sediminum TaxID=718193 RepID=A0A1G8W3D2_9GAMM|nr:polyhydroxyalkanoic acid system family protein [Ferrimonas sediminum]SDJ72597.1 putative polyhydroxyalkanoic acid system protein [Ferrimonas sediminum]